MPFFNFIKLAVKTNIKVSLANEVVILEVLTVKTLLRWYILLLCLLCL